MNDHNIDAIQKRELYGEPEAWKNTLQESVDSTLQRHGFILPKQLSLSNGNIGTRHQKDRNMK